ncbi:cytosine permease [Streptomyces sp. NPDC019937]|uniref:cytosine permease n=1 Tax=Streptomyces sp. NPDC019937 TaxID=3154787 RepID=UPI0033EB7CE0
MAVLQGRRLRQAHHGGDVPADRRVDPLAARAGRRGMVRCLQASRVHAVFAIRYWLIRKGRVNVPRLYTMDASGPYHYTRGFNPRAIAAFVPAAVPAVLLALVPAFAPAAPFAWFIGAGVAAVAYFLVSNRRQVHEDVPEPRSPSRARTEPEPPVTRTPPVR